MKRRFVFSVIFVCCFNPAFSQLEIGSNGNVGINYSGNSTIQSNLSINGAGDSQSCTSILSENDDQDVGLKVMKLGEVINNNNYTRGLYSTVRQEEISMRMAYGVYSRAYKDDGVDSYTGRSYGVYAYAGNSTSGWNYGVFGSLYGNNNGAGVFGSSSSLDSGMNTNGKYAGYFHGNVKTTDAMYATVYNTTSDYRLKDKIETVDQESVDKIMKLNVVKYNLKQLPVDMGDTAKVQVNYYTDDSKILERTHYGLLAQELQDIYPDLVYEGEDGLMSVNYIELIPLLIQSIQSLRKEVDQLKGNQKSSKRINLSSPVKSEDLVSSINKISVSDKTITIECSLPDAVKNANVLIFDANGNQYYSVKVIERGRIEINITDLTMDSGIYLCSMVSDEDMDSRRFYYGD